MFQAAKNGKEFFCVLWVHENVIGKNCLSGNPVLRIGRREIMVAICLL
jgi:hypothetical protein